MDNRSIGIFDSGVGGLTVMKQIMDEMPYENIVYFGDTGRVPYGTKSRETIMKYSQNDVRFLESHNVKLIIIACGTASSAALPEIKSQFQTPIIGVIEATAEAAVRATKNRKIGVIGTAGTIKIGAYEKIIHSYGIDTYKKACPLFVPLVENGHFDTQVVKLVVEEYLTPIRDAGVDTLILGCTHYPHLKKIIGEFMGNDVALIDPGVEIAKFLKNSFDKEMLHSQVFDKDRYQYFVSDSAKDFEELASVLLHKNINGKVKKIDIEKY